MLQQGVDVWNKWKREHPSVRPDLNRANPNLIDLNHRDLNYTELYRINLRGANLCNADLRVVDLRCADLYDAFLNHANLSNAFLSQANLSSANLSGANLGSAYLSGANLSSANLSNADLSGVNFSGANLSGSNFTGTKLLATVFANVDLRGVEGLGSINHLGPSEISISTIYLSGGDISEVFLRDAGVPATMIEYMRSLVVKPIDFYSCFISYSSNDEDFAKRLHADLQSKGVRCWFAPEDLKWGEKIRTGIDEAIHLYDKLLLVLSKTSVASQWVEQEVATALAKERKENRIVLFPIRLDNSIMEVKNDWPFFIRNTRNIGDFSRWKRHDNYQKAFTRLLCDLTAPPQKEGT